MEIQISKESLKAVLWTGGFIAFVAYGLHIVHEYFEALGM